MNELNEFRNSGLLWFTNRILHCFNWVLTVELDNNDNVISLIPEKTELFGFDEKTDNEKLKQFREYLR